MAHPETLVSSFSFLFVLCKFCGIYPYSLGAFNRDKSLQASKWGTMVVLVYMVVVLVLYNFLIYSFNDDDDNPNAKQSTLTFVIGLFLNYIAPAMLVVDQFTAISNQKKVGNFFNRINSVDEKLGFENIFVDNRSVHKRISIMVALAIVAEITIMVATCIYLVDCSKWYSILWIMSCVPTLLSTFDKIWFAALLYSLKQRFKAINTCLDALVESHNKLQLNDNGNDSELVVDRVRSNVLGLYSGNSYKAGKGKIFPSNNNVLISTAGNSFRIDTNSKKPKLGMMEPRPSELSNPLKMDAKLTNFCQLHDEICELGKWLNELWSYPVLVLMAYGFLIFTAQLYFLYCGTQGQHIPSLFRSAKNAIITTIYLLYTSGKCIYLIYLSWKTSLESKRTGICLHKCGVAADNNELYEIVNHLSLKLLNHSVDFSACGFFTLDMETLYGVSGGITSYLIILIQFNLAAQQAKEAVSSSTTIAPTTPSPSNETANMLVDNLRNTSNYVLNKVGMIVSSRNMIF